MTRKGHQHQSLMARKDSMTKLADSLTTEQTFRLYQFIDPIDPEERKKLDELSIEELAEFLKA